MQVETQDFLRLVENANSQLFFDFETTGREADYDTALVFAVKPSRAKSESIAVARVGDDKRIVREAKERLETADCWVSYYGKGFDVKFLNTRLLAHGIAPVEKRPHLDLYFVVRHQLLTGRKSMAHMADWLRLKRRKMSVSSDDWAVAPAQWPSVRPTMIRRCESDCEVLQDLYAEVKHLVAQVTR